MSIKKSLNNLTNLVLNTFFPELCLGCSTVLQNREIAFCAKCIKSLSYVNYSYACEICFSKKHKKDERNCIIHSSLDRNISLLHIDESIRKFIYEIKYYFRKRLLIDFLSKIETVDIYGEEPGLIIPVPLHKKRQKWREFNQAEIIAKWLSDKINIPVNNSALKRIKKTLPQSKAGLEEREENIQNAFSIEDRISLPKTVMLVDDILTTGQTLSECAKVLKQNGVERVISFTLIRA